MGSLLPSADLKGTLSKSHASLVFLGLALGVPSPTCVAEGAAEFSAEELAVIDARLAPVEPYARRLQIDRGDTRFFEVRFRVPAGRVRKPASDYEGIVTGIVAPAGIVVHADADRLTLVPRGAQVEVRFVYALHVDPGTPRGGRVRLTAAVVERTGLANTVDRKTLRHRVKLRLSRPSDRDLAADFVGYRLYNRRARALRQRMGTMGSRLRMGDQARLPSLSRVRARVARAVQRFGRLRRRMWAAHRHLVDASQHPDAQISNVATRYLERLAEPETAPTSVPLVPLVQSPPATEPIEKAAPASEGRTRPLEPVATYDPNAPTEPPPPPPPPPLSPIASTPEVASSGSDSVSPSRANTLDPGAEIMSTDILGERTLRKQTPIPGFSRGLVLDDPNIAHGAFARLVWAEATVRESAVASAFFFHAQAALTRFLGVEVTVPTELVDIEEPDGQDRIQSVFAAGNPLLAVKYRFHLPAIQSRQPALTLRARWSIPLSPLHLIPPTTLGAEDFTREVHFADTYAFLLEKTGLGLGINAAYQWGMVHFGAQAGSDVFIAVGDIDTTNKVTINYGLSVGVLPFGDLVGGFLEARAVSLLPARTELFTYLGARGRVFGFVEPALWLGLPLGSVRNANSFQIGAELRLSYDIHDVVETRSLQRRDDPLLK